MSAAPLFPQNYSVAASSSDAIRYASPSYREAPGLPPTQREVDLLAASTFTSGSCSPRTRPSARLNETSTTSAVAPSKLGSGLRQAWSYLAQEDAVDPLRVGAGPPATQGPFVTDLGSRPSVRAASGGTSISINSPDLDSASQFSSPLLVETPPFDATSGGLRPSSGLPALKGDDVYAPSGYHRRPSHIIAIDEYEDFPLPPPRSQPTMTAPRKRSGSAPRDRTRAPSQPSISASASSSRFSRLMDIFTGLAAPAAQPCFHQRTSQPAHSTQGVRQHKAVHAASRRRSSQSTSSHAAAHSRRASSPYEVAMQTARSQRSRASRARYGHHQAEHLMQALALYQSAQKMDLRRIQPLIERIAVLLQLVADHLDPLDAVDQLTIAVEDIKSAQLRCSRPDRRLSLSIARAEATQALAESLHDVARGRGDPSAFAASASYAAKDAMSLWEDIASEYGDMTDRARAGPDQRTLAAESALIYISLAESCLLVTTSSASQAQLDNYHELVAIALDQASAMTLIAKPVSGPATINNPFLTKIHLVACKADLLRIVATRQLSGMFDELEMSRIISDLQTLATRERGRSRSLRGSKSIESLKTTCQIEHLLGDVEIAYAALLRRTLERAGSLCGTASPMLKAGPTKRFLQREGSVTSGTVHPSGVTAASISQTTMNRLMDADQAYGLSEEIVVQSGRRRSSVLSRRPSWMPSGDLSDARAKRRTSLFDDSAALPMPIASRRISLISQTRIDAADAEIQAEVLSLITSASKHYQRALNALPLQIPSVVPLKTKILLDLANAKMAAAVLIRTSGNDTESQLMNLKVAESFALWAAKETKVADFLMGEITDLTVPRTSGENDLRLAAALTMQRVQHLRSKLGHWSPKFAQSNAIDLQDRCRQLPGGREAHLRYLTSLRRKWGDLGKNALEEWGAWFL